MQFRTLVWLCAMAVTACGHADNTPRTAPASASASASAPAVSGARSSVPAEPPAVMVLKDVYGVPFKSEAGQRLDGGAFAGFWAGALVPDAGASQVYVALTNETPGPEQEYPKAQDRLNLSGAIYRKDASGAWLLQAKQRAFGQFGAQEEPPRFAEGVPSVWLKVSEGKAIWAVPTVVPAMGGARFEFYELIGVDWSKGQLKRLGHLRAAESAPVDCKPRGAQACFKWNTRLSLVPGAAGAEWPALEAVRTGDRFDPAQGRVVPLNERLVFPFDAKTGSLRISEQ